MHECKLGPSLRRPPPGMARARAGLLFAPPSAGRKPRAWVWVPPRSPTSVPLAYGTLVVAPLPDVPLEAVDSRLADHPCGGARDRRCARRCAAAPRLAALSLALLSQGARTARAPEPCATRQSAPEVSGNGEPRQHLRPVARVLRTDIPLPGLLDGHGRATDRPPIMYGAAMALERIRRYLAGFALCRS